MSVFVQDIFGISQPVVCCLSRRDSQWRPNRKWDLFLFIYVAGYGTEIKGRVNQRACDSDNVRERITFECAWSRLGEHVANDNNPSSRESVSARVDTAPSTA